MGIKKQKRSSALKREPRIRFLDGPIPSLYKNTISQSPFSGLMGALQSVDINSPESKPNKTSINDNNGGRIELNQEDIIKKEYLEPPNGIKW